MHFFLGRRQEAKGARARTMVAEFQVGSRAATIFGVCRGLRPGLANNTNHTHAHTDSETGTRTRCTHARAAIGLSAHGGSFLGHLAKSRQEAERDTRGSHKRVSWKSKEANQVKSGATSPVVLEPEARVLPSHISFAGPWCSDAGFGESLYLRANVLDYLCSSDTKALARRYNDLPKPASEHMGGSRHVCPAALWAAWEEWLGRLLSSSQPCSPLRKVAVSSLT